MSQRVVFFLGIALILPLSSWAEEAAALDADDRLYDMEAQISSLKAELEATKAIATQERANAFNPSISVVGDFIGQYGYGIPKKPHEHGSEEHSHGGEFENGLMAREIEFEFRGDVDPYADAMVALAVAPHGFDHVDVHLEEAYARIKRLPYFGTSPLGLITKVGRFRTAIGRMSRIHLHNIPQITYPLAMRRFLGDEGYASQGISFNFAFNPTASTALNFFAEGVFLNRTPLQEKGSEKMPSGIGHIWWHQELAPFHYLDVGVSSLLGQKGKKNSGVFWLLGNDIHYAYLPPGYGKNPLFLLGNEFFTANQNQGQGRWPIGNFTWAQIRLMGSTFLGARYDLAPQEEDLQSFQHAASTYLTHYTTEFLRFRLGYEHVMPNINSLVGDHRVMLSMIFIMGSHPVEPYFINR